MTAAPRAVIFGLEGLVPTEAEKRLFTDCNPLGFILFSRNCADPEQTAALTMTLRTIVDRADAPILIDQEGGRVQRLRGPQWREAPAAEMFGELCAADTERAASAVWLNHRLMAAELAELGISVDCAPVLDVRCSGAHEIIGDRAFGAGPEIVAILGGAACRGLLAGGVLPVIKHIPGHGRACADSHLVLPVVDVPRDELEAVDFAPFRALAGMPLAMTAHVVYSAVDPHAPATTSAAVMADVIRGSIGFDGLLMSDDLCMRALCGEPGERAQAALVAGCDVVLHCNGDLGEMAEIATTVPPLTRIAQQRLARAQALLRAPVPLDLADAHQSLMALLGAPTAHA